MGQVNVNPGPAHDSGSSGAGMLIGLLFGLILFLGIGWFAVTQSGLFGPAAGAASRPSTNVSVTTNNPPATGGQTTGGGR